MGRGGARFSTDEIAIVLSHYDIGEVKVLKPLSVGSRFSPKMVVISDKGEYLLKRKGRGKADFGRVAFSHSVQHFLLSSGFPITSIIRTDVENRTILQIENHIYEMFKFVKGVRYDGSESETKEAGYQLGRFHFILSDFVSKWKALRSSFHNNLHVRHHLAGIGSNSLNGRDMQMHEAALKLTDYYDICSERVKDAGFSDWSEQVVHGDWHPGNLLYSDGKIIAVLDFDSVKMAPAVTDIANGLLQFSIIADKGDPSGWPDHFDVTRMSNFLYGYRRMLSPGGEILNCVVDLMVQTMIAEAVLPIAATGFFGVFKGLDFLSMIRRKTQWLLENREELTEVFKPSVKL